MNVFETERLVVRHLRDDDVDDFAALCGDPVAMRYMGDGQPLTREQTARWIEVSQANYRARGYGCFAVTLKPEDRLIGFCGLVGPPLQERVELIYAFAQPFWGRGLATEVAQAAIVYGFGCHGLERIEATIYPANHASQRVLEKIGMIFQRRETDEHGVDTDFYAATRPLSP